MKLGRSGALRQAKVKSHAVCPKTESQQLLDPTENRLTPCFLDVKM